MNFYTKVLSKFAATAGLKLTLRSLRGPPGFWVDGAEVRDQIRQPLGPQPDVETVQADIDPLHEQLESGMFGLQSRSGRLLQIHVQRAPAFLMEANARRLIKQPLPQRRRPLLPVNRPPRASPARRAPSGPAYAPGSLLEES
jgi:hypothetical protein